MSASSQKVIFLHSPQTWSKPKGLAKARVRGQNRRVALVQKLHKRRRESAANQLMVCAGEAFFG